MLAAIVLLGIAWSYLAGSSIRVTFRWKYLFFLGLLFTIMLLINFEPLRSVLPWRGDEDHHIRTAINLFRQVGAVPWFWVLLVFLFWMGILVLAWFKPKISLLAGVLFIGAALLFYPPKSQFGVLRYPFINYWINLFAVYPIGMKYGAWHEFLYRIVPFLAAVGTAWVFQRSLIHKKDLSHMLWGVAVAVIPTVYYYSSIFYLEMPAVMLMTLACLYSEQLLDSDFRELKKNIGWYALILVGFIKETTLPFLLCFVACRFLVRLWQLVIRPKTDEKKISFGHFILGELPVYFVVLLPIVYYLAFRVIFADTRPYTLSPANLLDPSVYKVLAYSFFDQFGLFIFLFIGGVVLLAIKKKFPALFFFLAIIIGYGVFYILDQKIYVGYSRFNLFFLPPVLAGAGFLIKWIIGKKRFFSYALAIMAITLSLSVDTNQYGRHQGTGWGNYFFSTSEQYYPVEKAYAHLRDQYPDKSVLFAGMYYEYNFFFYVKKLGWRPPMSDILISDINLQDDSVNLRNALHEADQRGFDNILFFVIGDEIPVIPEGSPFEQDRVFQNDAHTIVVFNRISP